MRTAQVTIKGISPYSQSKFKQTEREGNETHAAHERRTWPERQHIDGDGYVFVPPMAFKNGLVSAAKFLGRKIPGAGNKTYTKRFESGVLCMQPLTLDVLGKDVPGEELFLPSDGVRGSGKRVIKTYPRVDNWGGTFEVQVIDEAIDEKVFTEHLEAFGKFIGIGRFRPERNGYYGRFEITKIEWV